MHTHHTHKDCHHTDSTDNHCAHHVAPTDCQKNDCSSHQHCEKDDCSALKNCCHHAHNVCLTTCHHSKNMCELSNKCSSTPCCSMSRCCSKYQSLIVLLLVTCAFTRVNHTSITHEAMYAFMGYLLVLFSMLKLFNIRAFIERFAAYDLITPYFRVYGYIYPLIELSLGLSYLFGYSLILVNKITIGVMLLTGLGVLNALASCKDLKCACVGGCVKLPLGGMSLVENFGTAAMAAYLLNYPL